MQATVTIYLVTYACSETNVTIVRPATSATTYTKVYPLTPMPKPTSLYLDGLESITVL